MLFNNTMDFSFLTSIFLTFYTVYLFSLFNKKNRKKISEKNKKLEKYRKKPIKTLEEQKQFLSIKDPKKPKWRFTWKWLGKTIIRFAIFITLIRIYLYIMNYLGVVMNIWWFLIIVIPLPILVNLLLSKFSLENDYLKVFFR